MIIVVATDAPLSDRQLERVAARAMLGLGRTGSDASNGSGDYVIAFSTSPDVRRRQGEGPARAIRVLADDAVSPIFQATIEATEEAIYNSLFRATDVSSARRTVTALPIDSVRTILRKHGVGSR